MILYSRLSVKRKDARNHVRSPEKSHHMINKNSIDNRNLCMAVLGLYFRTNTSYRKMVGKKKC